MRYSARRNEKLWFQWMNFLHRFIGLDSYVKDKRTFSENVSREQYSHMCRCPLLTNAP